MVLLVKPQFEVERGQVGKGGIVRDAALHQAACDRVRGAVEALGFGADIIESPILGAEGNREFLLYASHQTPSASSRNRERQAARVAPALVEWLARGA